MCKSLCQLSGLSAYAQLLQCWHMSTALGHSSMCRHCINIVGLEKEAAFTSAIILFIFLTHLDHESFQAQIVITQCTRSGALVPLHNTHLHACLLNQCRFYLSLTLFLNSINTKLVVALVRQYLHDQKQWFTTHHEAQLHMFALLQQGGSNPIIWLAIGVINLPGTPEMMQGLVPVAVPPLQDTTVQTHLAAVHAHLHINSIIVTTSVL